MKMRSRVVAAMLTGAVLLLSVPEFALASSSGSSAKSKLSVAMTGLNPTQRNSISMLNHLAVLTQEINASQYSRLYLEEAYSSLINNTYPNAVDERTLRQLTNILDVLEKYRMVAVKRERLEYVYEQNRAETLRAAVPSPLGLMSAIQSPDVVKLVTSVGYMALDSITSYVSASKQANMQYLQEGWALDDEAATALHDSRKGTFSYMMQIVRGYDLPGDLTLSEAAVEEFVKWENNENVVRRIQFFESNQETYQALGTYWIVLAKSYYENKQYDKCLNAVASYESLGLQIFRKDYEYARILPLAVIAAGEVLPKNQYVNTVKHYLEAIESNTDYSDWVSRYFVAQAYVELHNRTGRQEYLKKAYDVVLDNVNDLVSIQGELNTKYLEDVKTIDPPKDATKAEKADISEHNKSLKEERKKALPPVYKPLVLNCELLFALAEELDISVEKQQTVEGILHNNGENIFLTTQLDNRYRFSPAVNEYDELHVSFDGKKLILPASLVSECSVITITVTPAEGEPVVFTDWEVSKVDRKEKENLASFEITYQSATAPKYEYAADAKIGIDIADSISGSEPIHYEYVTTAEKMMHVFDAVGFTRVEE